MNFYSFNDFELKRERKMFYLCVPGNFFIIVFLSIHSLSNYTTVLKKCENISEKCLKLNLKI